MNTKLTFGSLFAGLGGFDAACERNGMRCLWQIEIDPQCRSVLGKHFPAVERYTDVKEEANADNLVRPELICGGFPCQDLSVAGKRAGLAGKRSGLFFDLMRIVERLAPRWVLLENVPGLLSSNGGRDMGTVLWTLGQLGYGWAYRVLDAQWFGVPQRRRRVFIVGCLGDGRRAAEVLFERESLPWDSPPSRETRSRIAASLTAGVAASSGVNRPGRRREDDFNIVAFAQNQRDECRDLKGVAGALAAEPGMKQQTYIANVAHTLRAEGHDASEDGTGRGVPLVAHALTATATATGRLDPNGETFIPSFAIQERAVSENLENGPQGKGYQEGIAYTLEARSKVQMATSRQGVRRLTPRECERLQGFPDDWTRYGEDGKQISDSARYRMLGNAVAVPVVEWIARRIMEAVA